jgi:alpha-1,2-mannosyltransferase
VTKAPEERPPSPAGLWQRRPGRRLLLIAGLVAAAMTTAAYLWFTLTHVRGGKWVPGYDLWVYVWGARTVLHIAPAYHPSAPAPLYVSSGAPGAFVYPPFAAIVFAVLAALPWQLVLSLWTAASIVALVLTVWLTLGGAGYRPGMPRLGGTLLLSAVLFWAAPVMHAINNGQVELMLMALIMWDLCQPGRRWWQGIGVGIAAGIKLVALIFIPYLLITRRYRQAAVAAATFTATVALGFGVLPGDSRVWWLDGLFHQTARIGFVGFEANQSLPGLITRLAGSIAAGNPVWLIAAALAGAIGLASAWTLHRAGYVMEGVLTCAVTGVLISPVSWDNHWVWIVPVVVALVCCGLRSPAYKYAWLAAATTVVVLFGAWPGLVFGQRHSRSIFFEGLIYWPPASAWGQFFLHGDQPSYPEYHWHGLQLIVGNLYVLTGMTLLVLAAVVSVLLVRLQSRRGRHTLTSRVPEP